MKSYLHYSFVLLAAGVLILGGCLKDRNIPEGTNVIEVKHDLAQASTSSDFEIQKFKVEATKMLNDNDESILRFKTIILRGTDEVRAKYDPQLTALEEINNELRIRLESYPEDNPENWEAFKEEFQWGQVQIRNGFKEIAHQKPATSRSVSIVQK